MAVYTTIQKVKAKQSDDNVIKLRDEQEHAVHNAFVYFKGRKLKPWDPDAKKKETGPKFLWNAKMRFGKTICALELAKRLGELRDDRRVRKTLVVTHRPVVKKSWGDDFKKIFGDNNSQWFYASKFDNSQEGDFYALEEAVANEDKSYVFFASMQYLRRSTIVGGDDEDQLKKDILNNDWDMVVIDEAHEGTRTNLGHKVIDILSKTSTYTLHLSGTPFNLYDDFTDNQIYTWDYIKEQTAKREWAATHPEEPEENNPYRELPEMEIRTYDLGSLVKSNCGEGASFNFKEFFKVIQGNKAKTEDPEHYGRFVHEDAVRQFLNLMCTDDDKSHYPFSTEEYRESFNHTLWVVPGVKEAKALENLLREHEVFGTEGGFEIINVAGSNEDDEKRSDALDKVIKRIGDKPDQTYSITISCGRLTTGVTVRPWTAVFYLKGSENTSAATYMQTIFRVQSPYHFVDANGNFRMKTRCYVFDFAPDRSLKMVAETAKFTTLTQKEKEYVSATTNHQKDVENMSHFLSFCPVISMEGGQMVNYDPEHLFEQLHHVYVDRVVRNGFNDNSVYDIRELMALNPEEIKDLNLLGNEISKTTNMEKPKKATNIDLAKNGLTDKQKKDAAAGEKNKREGKEVTPEQQAAMEAAKKKKEEERKERDNRITILRAIALRIPLMMFGAKVDDENTGITLENFTRIIDDGSWREFMPRGVDKPMFNKFRKCFNAAIFVAAGKRYRQLAREADEMSVEDRIARITEIHSYFHNPDKETVLTPWRVVNMQLGETLGGYNFFNERYDGPNEVEVPGENGSLFDYIPTNQPRYVDLGLTTQEVFNSESKILEINSKTGLYPLYVTYSLYRQRCKDFIEAGLIEDENNFSVEEEQVIWDDIIQNNVYVICNTLMAQRITLRTLLGFRYSDDLKGKGISHIKEEHLIERALEDKDSLVNDLRATGFWNGTRSKEEMKFNAVVGNPPYQVVGGGGGSNDASIYQEFCDISFKVAPLYSSMIVPSRWYTGGRENLVGDFRKHMLQSGHVVKMISFADAKDLFENAEIKGGCCFFLYSPRHNGRCNYSLVRGSDKLTVSTDLSRFDIFIREPILADIVQKVKNKASETIEGMISSDTPFGIPTNPEESVKNPFKVYSDSLDEHDTLLFLIRKDGRGTAYISRSCISKNSQDIDKPKVLIPKAYGASETFPHQIIGVPEIAPANSVCSQSYIYCSFQSEEESWKFSKYLKTKFLRALVCASKASQDAMSKVYRFVPMQDFKTNNDIDWSLPICEIDKQLYRKYGLSASEINFIEKMIKPME